MPSAECPHQLRIITWPPGHQTSPPRVTVSLSPAPMVLAIHSSLVNKSAETFNSDSSIPAIILSNHFYYHCLLYLLPHNQLVCHASFGWNLQIDISIRRFQPQKTGHVPSTPDDELIGEDKASGGGISAYAAYGTECSGLHECTLRSCNSYISSPTLHKTASSCILRLTMRQINWYRRP